MINTVFDSAHNNFEPLLTADCAASLLKIHKVTLLRWAREGRINCIRLGRKVMFRASLLDAALALGVNY